MCCRWAGSPFINSISMVVSPSSTASMISALEIQLGLGSWYVHLIGAWLGLSVLVWLDSLRLILLYLGSSRYGTVRLVKAWLGLSVDAGVPLSGFYS
ncbi:dehydration-responsive element-binding protein 2A [Pyrus ussuriensis x Pyrus communis]|uniref:Dehydration-responsive element-binding protein 2A n=1 Tax=Pyrus ussuriensis x Pyrus communis TaxID=2448454 RepID=A0A5N5GNC2_9ROSA|nr:dehydration-responsive element-binding protein 2A [Pyrus ussuriensis x Pyrus communis]